tara:strand:+ start:198 stop:356 length:159 start_codon:yes stop_codon:yes gene_type:complete
MAKKASKKAAPKTKKAAAKKAVKTSEPKELLYDSDCTNCFCTEKGCSCECCD